AAGYLPKLMAESLPEDILIDILLRVPAELLARFKFVCKRWRSLISDPGFAKSHLQRLKAGDLIPSQRIFIGRLYGSHETIDYAALDGSEGGVVVPHRIKTIRPLCDCHVVGSCDGLVCLYLEGNLYRDYPTTILIYNPATRECNELRCPEFAQDSEFREYRENESFHGIGYDPRSDDYKIVEGIRGFDYKIVEGIHEVEFFWEAAIFSLKSGSWRSINFPIEEESGFSVSGNGVYWKGALHWYVYDYFRPVIISLDLSEEKFNRVLSVPKVNRVGFFSGLGIHGTSLFMYNSRCDNHIEAWITDEYGRGGSWTKWFSVDRLPTFRDAAPLAYTRSGQIVFLINVKRAIMFNPEDNTYKDYPIRMDDCFEYAIYSETLVSPYLGG
ncbi:hypothetical protein EUGRSUZ_H02653, partial [Eucalyptus grandis]